MKFTPNYYAHSAVFFEVDKEGLREFYEGFMAALPYSLDELFAKIWRTPASQTGRRTFMRTPYFDLPIGFNAHWKARTFRETPGRRRFRRSCVTRSRRCGISRMPREK